MVINKASGVFVLVTLMVTCLNQVNKFEQHRANKNDVMHFWELFNLNLDCC